MMNRLDEIGEELRVQFELQNSLRERAITLARELTRYCANTIRALHRQEWDSAKARLQEVRAAADEIRHLLADQPELYYAGYTQDSLKEYVETFLAYALIRNEPPPSPQDLEVTPSTYINGLAEACTELRRRILDVLRHDQHEEAERLLEVMDNIFILLMTMDYPDALTGGLRRRTDTIRSTLEKTRGDLTLSLRQQILQDAIHALSQKLDAVE